MSVLRQKDVEDSCRAESRLGRAMPASSPGDSMSRTDFVTPQDASLVLIDYQPAMYQGVESHDRLSVMHNVQALAKAARLFKLPTLLSTVAKDSFAGPFMPEVTDLFPGAEVIDRTSINAWLDANFRKAVEAMDRKRIILAGLWTE